MKIRKRSVATLVSLTCSASLLTGCVDGVSVKVVQDSDKSISWSVNETINADSSWINSCLEKSVDQTTKASLKDDYYTAVNLEDMVADEETIAENQQMGTMEDGLDLLTEQLNGIMYGTMEIHESNIPMDTDDLNHDIQLVQDFTKTLTDWDTRNKNGVEALSPYLETIENIDSMDDLNTFVLNVDYQAICDPNLVDFGVVTVGAEPNEYQVLLEGNPTYSLANTETGLDYDVYNGNDSEVSYIPAVRDENKETITNILSQIGYSEKDINKIIKNCYKFESKLASISVPTSYYRSNDFYYNLNGNYTLKQLKEIEGNYPLTDIIKSVNYDSEDKYVVADDGYIAALGKIYDESNLEQIKDMYIVRTVLAAQSLLDEDTFNAYLASTEDEDATQQEKDEDSKTVVSNEVNQYLAGPLNVIYVSQYVTSEQKEELSQLTTSIKEELREMFKNETWLSKSTRKKILEKIDALEEHVLYPDTFESYDFYQVDANDSLLEMVAKLNVQKKKNDANKINTQTDRSNWDLDDPNVMSTITYNCSYMPQSNGIYICAGFLAGGKTYSVDMSKEQKYAFCTVLGHEITHGFDTTGSYYDKNGYKKSWWDVEDTLSFTKQVAPLENYYSALNPYPGSEYYDGATVSGEAIADLGGMKATLSLASKQSDFDYDAFFRAYAKLWEMKLCGDYASSLLNDVHPAANLRVNVVVSQFDEFIKTYDIKKGDGMYVAKENRILVW